MTPEAGLPGSARRNPTAVRGPFRLLLDPVFGPFFWGKALAASGLWIHSLVAAIVAYDMTGSTLMVGAVTAVQFAPQLLLAPLSGTLADAGNGPRQIVVGRFLMGAGSGSLAVWLWAAGGVEEAGSVVPLFLGSLLAGVGFVLGGPATQSIVPSLIRPGEMASAMALSSVPMTIARAAGPAVGAAVTAAMSPAAAFAIAAGCSTTFGVIVLALRLPRGQKPGRDTDLSVRAGLRHVRGDRPLMILLLSIAAIGAGGDPAVTLAPALAERLDGGTSLIGWLASSFGIGAGLGIALFSISLPWFDVTRMTPAGLVLMAGGFGIAATSWLPAVALLGYTTAGIGMSVAFTSTTTLIQNRAPDELRGRIMSLWFLGYLGARPFAAALNGFAADAAGVNVALGFNVLLVGTAAWFCRPARWQTREARTATAAKSPGPGGLGRTTMED